MTITGLIALLFILIFFALIIIFAVAGRNRPDIHLREIKAFSRFKRAIDLAVESGSCLHLSIGRGNITSTEISSTLIALSMLEKITRSASASDRPPVVTAGDPALAILAQDTLRGTYKSISAIDQYDPTGGRLTGLTPFSYAAGAMPIIRDENISTNILIGNFGNEVALITDAGERSSSVTLAGTDNISTQAVLYATANEPLIGEEVYAGGAYVQAGPTHKASLRAQDALRWVIAIVILLGVLLKLSGLDHFFQSSSGGLP
jgi:hypothetical protein